MGVAIYYSGRLKNPGLIQELVSELSDIASARRWPCTVLDDPWDQAVTVRSTLQDGTVQFHGNAGLKGVILRIHPEMDMLSLLFDHEGVCRSLEDMTQEVEDRHGYTHVGTQESGIDAHIEAVLLLQYVGEKYMESWSLDDDSGFAEHGDREKALSIFETIQDAMNAVSEAFETIEFPENISGNEEAFLSLVEDRIRTYLPGAEVRRIEDEEE